MTFVSFETNSLPIGRNDFDEQRARLAHAKIFKRGVERIFVVLPT
jgi:hypothetical protein